MAAHMFIFGTSLMVHLILNSCPEYQSGLKKKKSRTYNVPALQWLGINFFLFVIFTYSLGGEM